MTPLGSVVASDIAGARLVRLSGEIDLSNASEVLELIGAQVPHDADLVVLDLSRTSYLDSTGVAMVFHLAHRLRTRRQELHLVVPLESPIRAVLELTNVHRVVAVRETVEAAIRS
ncbi:MAG: STAS domain-containing protein [Nostocoides sp.]